MGSQSTGRSAGSTTTATAAKTTAATGARAGRLGGLARQEAFALSPLASQLARTAYRFRLLADPPLRGLLVIVPELHLAENPLALHLFLERLQGLIDVVVTDKYLQADAFLKREAKAELA
jgi:hypothetical protein